MSSYPTESQDRLEVLYRQEVSFYLTTDYLSTLIHRQAQDNTVNSNNSKGDDGTSNSKMLNQHWREVMCEWAYHGKYNCSARTLCVSHLKPQPLTTTLLLLLLQWWTTLISPGIS